jgi:hypothetical protein
MTIKITSAFLYATKSDIDEEIPISKFNGIIPRKDEIIYIKNNRLIVVNIIFDYDFNEITIRVKDYLG